MLVLAAAAEAVAEVPAAVARRRPRRSTSRSRTCRQTGLWGVIAMAAGMRANGQLRRVRPGYTTADKEVNAFVSLGEGVDNSTLIVAWYRLKPGGGRERLFSHEIAVASGGRARSQGVAPSGLAPGIYETVATLGDRQVRTPWVVTESTDDQGSASAAAQAAEAPPAVPDPGIASIDYFDLPYSGPPRDGPCALTDASAHVQLQELRASGDWVGRCSSLTVAATVAGPPLTLVTEDLAEGGGAGTVGAVY